MAHIQPSGYKRQLQVISNNKIIFYSNIKSKARVLHIMDKGTQNYKIVKTSEVQYRPL